MINRIIVGVDFSYASRAALEHAISLSQKLKIPLVAVHVLQPSTPFPLEIPVAIQIPGWSDAWENHARDRLEQWAIDIPNLGTQIKWGNPAEELALSAGQDSMLVVGQTSQSRFESLLFGGTVARIMELANCEVLVVPFH